MKPRILIMGEPAATPQPEHQLNPAGQLYWAEKDCQEFLSPIADIVVSPRPSASTSS
jgi:hypothetical protein